MEKAWWILPRDPRQALSRTRKKTDLAFCTSYEDETSADGEQYQAYKTSELEGIAPMGCRTSSMKYAQCSLRSEKEAAFGFATLAAEPSYSGCASDSVML